MVDIDIEDIPDLPDRERRLEAVVVDCYSADEALTSLDVYVTDALRPPFPAIWRDPDEATAVPVVVRGTAGADERGVLLLVERAGQEVAAPATLIWADESGRNDTVLDDYRCWRDELGLPEDDES